ncbi:zinc finger domain-containing protein [Streptomyces sp. NPDC004008]
MTATDRRATDAAYTTALEQFWSAHPMPEPMEFTCPQCSAPAGDPCVMKNGRTAPHGSRAVLGVRAAIEWAREGTRAAEAAVEALHGQNPAHGTEGEK